MDVYRTEEEQIEAIKQWWKTYGNHILIGIGLAIALIFGWQAWQDHKHATGEAAALAYISLMESVEALSVPPTSEELANVHYLADEVKTNHPGTQYALMAALMKARASVAGNEPKAAEQELRWILSEKPDAAMRPIVEQRIVRVLMMQEQYADALSFIDSVAASAPAGFFEELRGDIHVELGELDKARTAYMKAQAAAEQRGEQQQPLLKMKLDNLAVAS